MIAIDVQIDRAAFNDALDTVHRAVADKSRLPLLETIKLAATGGEVVLSATDLHLYSTMRVAASVAATGAIAVPARALVDWVGALPHGTVRLSLAAGATRVKASCGRANAAFVCLDAADFPSPPPISGTGLTLDAGQLRRALARVLPAIGTDDGQPALRCVALTPGMDGLHLATTDGSRLARMVVPGAVSAPFGQVLLPGRAAREFAHLLGAGGVAELRVGARRCHPHLTVGHRAICARLVEGDFPDPAQLIPGGVATRVAVETQGLRRALKLATFFGTGGRQPVICDAAPGRLRLYVPDADTGACETELAAAFEGRPDRVAVNVPLLAELLREADTPFVTLAREDATRPIVIREIDDEGVRTADLWLVMPLRHAEIGQVTTAAESAASAA